MQHVSLGVYTRNTVKRSYLFEIVYTNEETARTQYVSSVRPPTTALVWYPASGRTNANAEPARAIQYSLRPKHGHF
jgi:hypothetical protein